MLGILSPLLPAQRANFHPHPEYPFGGKESLAACRRRTLALPSHVDGTPLPTAPLPQASASVPEAPRKKLSKGSAQLNRWSRARALRSGRKIDWKKDQAAGGSASGPSSSSQPSQASETSGLLVASPEGVEDEGDDQGEAADAPPAAGKVIYMVSDGTGFTLEHAVGAALGQFEHCLVDRACAVNTHLFSGIDDVDHLLDIIKQAAKEGALLLYTLADPSMAEPAKQACRVWGVPFIDILGPTTEAIASHLGVAPSGIPRSERRIPLTDEYFQRIEAIDFTIKQDDGAQPQNLNRAHIVLVGVSRTGKTPLSIYLAQKGYKVANVPIVMGVELPKALFQVNQEKIYGLSINPVVLQSIRKARAKALGFSSEMKRNYSEMEHVREELEFASRIYAQNPLWPVIEVTGKAIEETAAVILRIYHDRRNKCSMPRISRRY